MRSLFVKFFLSFWLVIGLIIGTAAIGGFLYAERLQETIEDFEAGDSMLEASAAVKEGGRKGLVTWAEGLPRDDGVLVLIVDEHGRDILGRRIPFAVERLLQRHMTRYQRFRREDENSRYVRRSRYLPQLTAPDGAVYTMLVLPVRSPESIWRNSDVRVLLLLFALLTSGLVSYALAAAFSRPVRKLRDATIALSEGELDVRVADSLGKRRDELGMLGREFDTMAEKLQRAAKLQTELSRNISHELRSPLARMRVAVELARRKTGELTEFDRLDDETERLDSLIGQILSYTKLDADAERSASAVDLSDVVSEVAENVNFECKSERVKICHESDSGGVVSGFRGALVSAVENVVRNAIRHSPAQSNVIVTLAASNGRLSVTIEDDGPGVAEDDLAKLFEPFFRTRDSAEKDGNGGTGLGLAIARRAIELHNGQITAQNRETGGLVVNITLPSNG